MKPLKGIRVLDLSRVVSGPYCTMMLGDLGAEVIKIEKPFSGDETRSWGPPFLEKSGDSAYYIAVNRNKKSLTLNLKSDQGKKIITELIEQSDILVENFRLGVLDKLGFSYEKVKEINHQIIYCSISGFGSKGPIANQGGYDAILQAISGLMSITGIEEPTKVGIPIIDILTALFANQAILSALYVRSLTGFGQKVETSLLESMVASLVNVGSNFLVSGNIPKYLGNEHPNIYPYNSFKTKNGKIVIGVTNQKIWQGFCKSINKLELINDESFKDNSSRNKNRVLLKSILEPIILSKDTEEWEVIFVENEVPAGSVNNLKNVFDHPQVEANDMLFEINRPLDGNIKLAGIPVKFSYTKPSIDSHPPLLGEHNEEIICSLLKYSKDDFLDFKNKGVI